MTVRLRFRRPGTDVRAVTDAVAVLTIAVLALFLVGGLAVFIGPELGFGSAQLGLVAAMPFVSSALVSIPIGRLTERVGVTGACRNAILISGLCLVAIGLLPAGSGWVPLAVVLLFAGIAMALAQTASSALLAGAVSRGRQGLAFGLRQAAVPAGTLVAGIGVLLFDRPGAWRHAFVGLGVLTGLEYLRRRLRPGQQYRRAPAPTSRPPSPPTTSSRWAPGLIVLAFASAIGNSSSNATGAFYVDSAVSAGWSPGTAGLWLSLGSIAGILARLVWGHLVDTGHLRRRFICLLMLAGSLGTGLLALQSAAPLMVIGTLLVFTGGWAWTGLLYLAVIREVPEAPGAATGITAAGNFAGGVLGPVLFGFVAVLTTYQHAWFVSSFMYLLGSAIMLYGFSRMGGARPRSTHPDERTIA